MHFHKNSLNGIKAFVLLLITYTTWCDAVGLTSDEIAEAINIADLRTPGKYCGKRLTDAMKRYCEPKIRNAIMNSDAPVEKKSLDQAESEYDAFSIDEDDELARTRYRTAIDELYLSNDIPFIFPSQANLRRRRGIIDVCCKRACYKRELVKYCPPSRG